MSNVVLYMCGLGHEDYITAEATDAELAAWKRFVRLMNLCGGCGSPNIEFYPSMLALIQAGNCRGYGDGRTDEALADELELIALPKDAGCYRRNDPGKIYRQIEEAGA